MTIQEKKLKCSDNGGIHDIILRVQGKKRQSTGGGKLVGKQLGLNNINISSIFCFFTDS